MPRKLLFSQGGAGDQTQIEKKGEKTNPGRLAKLYETFIKKNKVSLCNWAFYKKPPKSQQISHVLALWWKEYPKGHSFQAVTEPESLMVYSKQQNCLYR